MSAYGGMSDIVVPSPPFVSGNIPVTPGVTSAVPLKEAADVLAKFVRIVRAVSNFVAEAARPVVLPVPPYYIPNGKGAPTNFDAPFASPT